MTATRFWLLPLLACSSLCAQSVELTSPLDGYLRAGKAAAVHIRAGGLSGPMLALSGAGMIALSIPTTGGRVDATVPLLWQGDPPAELNWSDGGAGGVSALRSQPLGVDDRLVLAAGESADTAALLAELFPSKRPVVVKLDTSQSRLLSPAAAFEAADAVLLDLAAASRVDESQLRTFLAAGTTVAIRAPVRPIAGWPWTQMGAWWVLRHDVAGPRGGVTPEIYDPTYAWDRSWPAPLRRNALLAAVAVAIVLLGVTLWRRRWALIAGVAICAAAGVWAALFGRSLPPAAMAGGEVIAWDGSLAQRDRYTYVSALRDGATATVAVEGLTKPLLGGRRPIDGLTFRLACAADGSPAKYEVTLPAKTTLAFLRRTVLPDGPPADAKLPVNEPIGLFADRLYPGNMTGQTTNRPADAQAEGEWWGTVIMQRQK
jgi:hypothetical protein